MEVIRSGILSQGAVTALVEHLTLTDAHILVSILQCLTMLVGDAEARAEVGVNDDCQKSTLQEYWRDHVPNHRFLPESFE